MTATPAVVQGVVYPAIRPLISDSSTPLLQDAFPSLATSKTQPQFVRSALQLASHASP